MSLKTFAIFPLQLFLLTSFTPSRHSTATEMHSIAEKNPINPENCTYKGIPLYGKVKVVEHFADFKVQVVSNFPDLQVQVVDYFPNQCGKWQFVENFPDFTIQYVEHFPDFKVEFVNHFPGVKK